MSGQNGLIQIYTGNGKGKTTQAVGQAVRARGHNLRVCFIHFFKEPSASPYGEDKILKKIGVKVLYLVSKHPHFYSNLDRGTLRKECIQSLDFIRKIFKQKFDMLILDEINICLRDGFLKEREVLSLLKDKPKKLEIILTGRGLTKGLIKKADLVSEVRKIKHYFDKGVKARKAIEY